MKLSEPNDVVAASKAIRNRAKEVVDAFDLDSDLSGTPTEAFSRVLADLNDAQRAILIEVAQRAYKIGAKRGAISALDAVIDRTINFELSGNDVVLTTTAKSIRIGARKLRISKSHRGEDLDVPVEKFSISREKLGFE
jgi:hypothetical protein